MISMIGAMKMVSILVERMVCIFRTVRQVLYYCGRQLCDILHIVNCTVADISESFSKLVYVS